jgi:hypothetical protein
MGLSVEVLEFTVSLHFNSPYFLKEFRSALDFLAGVSLLCNMAAVLRDSIKWTLRIKGSVCPNKENKSSTSLKQRFKTTFNQQTSRQKLK